LPPMARPVVRGHESSRAGIDHASSVAEALIGASTPRDPDAIVPANSPA